jgi:hypothetical protein
LTSAKGALVLHGSLAMGRLATSAIAFGHTAPPRLIQRHERLCRLSLAQVRDPNGGLVVMPDALTTIHRSKITSLAVRYGLPSVYPFRFFADPGGLMFYVADLVNDFERTATYAAARTPRTPCRKMPLATKVAGHGARRNSFRVDHCFRGKSCHRHNYVVGVLLRWILLGRFLERWF